MKTADEIARDCAMADKVRDIIRIYYAPWGAAKAAEWEFLTGDKPFTADHALNAIRIAVAAYESEEPVHG